MLLENERWVSHVELAIRPTPEQAPYTSIAEIVTALDGLIASNQAIYTLLDNKVLVASTELLEEDGLVTMLLHVGDARAANPGFLNMTTLRQREVAKGIGEAGGTSAQLTFSTTEILSGSHNYPGLLEMAPGVNRDRVERFLKHCLRVWAKDVDLRFPSPETGRPIQYRPLVHLRAVPSVSLNTAVDTGELRELRLIRSDVVDPGLDEDTWVKDTVIQHKFSVQPGIPGHAARDLITSVIARGKNMAAQKLTATVKQDKRYNSLELDLDETSPMEALLVKHEQIELDSPHGHCRLSISSEIDSQMRQLLS